MLTIDTLKRFGADTDDGLSRCLGNEDFYFKLIGKVVEDKNFACLEESIAAGDLDKAFDAAHSLKGVLGNLALTPIFNPVCELVELLRGKKEMVDTGTLVETILSEREKLCKLDA